MSGLVPPPVLRRSGDEHGIFMIAYCAYAIGSTWKGEHAGTWGHVGVFGFQQGEHLPTGDGGMMVTNEDSVYEKVHCEYGCMGESPALMVLVYRMNEMTAVVGLGQISRVMGCVEEYRRSPDIMNQAIAGCKWLRPRRVTKEAKQSAYLWGCVLEGDKQGLGYGRFKQACAEAGAAGIGFGFTQRPAYSFDFSRLSSACGYPNCPVRCPHYDSKHACWENLCPVAEDLIPCLVCAGVMGLPEEAAKRRSDDLLRAIDICDKGG